jgi:hypothetical protein
MGTEVATIPEGIVNGPDRFFPRKLYFWLKGFPVKFGLNKFGLYWARMIPARIGLVSFVGVNHELNFCSEAAKIFQVCRIEHVVLFKTATEVL